MTCPCCNPRQCCEWRETIDVNLRIGNSFETYSADLLDEDYTLNLVLDRCDEQVWSYESEDIEMSPLGDYVCKGSSITIRVVQGAQGVMFGEHVMPVTFAEDPPGVFTPTGGQRIVWGTGSIGFLPRQVGVSFFPGHILSSATEEELDLAGGTWRHLCKDFSFSTLNAYPIDDTTDRVGGCGAQYFVPTLGDSCLDRSTSGGVQFRCVSWSMSGA